jgi:transcriptional regulator with XRE-family HTH domain
MSAPPVKPEPKTSPGSGLIGGKLRALRKSRGMTLQAVADATKLSVGHLSQLERDITSPSVKTLHDIGLALGVNIGWFFDANEAKDADSRYVVRSVNRRRIHFADGIDDYQLNSRATETLGLLYSVFEPGASSGDRTYTHAGEEAGYVVSGQLEFWIDGEHLVVQAGDSFSFPSTSEHRYQNPGPDRTVVIWAMTPPSY